MPKSMLGKVLLALAILLSLNACGAYYRAYGYDWVSQSTLAEDVATRVELPPGAPSISQRYRPVNMPSDAGHKGIDLLVVSGTPVLAAADGVVAGVELSILYGRQIMLNHGQTSAGFPIQTRYYHLSEQLVKPGETVLRGQLLGYAGASGMAGLYPHLHFEVHRLDNATPAIALNYLDPQLFWVNGVGMITCFERQRAYQAAIVALTYPVPCKYSAWQ